MSTYHTQGLILSSHDFRESDKIFSIYTDTHGKIDALATGVRKIKSKLRAHLEPFSVVDLMIAHGRRHDRLVGAIQQKNYFRIKNNYPSQRLVSHWLKLLIINYQFLEIIDQLTKLHHPDIRIFNLIKETFDFIENQQSTINNQQPAIRSYFIIRFLSYLGYTPELKICVRCKNPISNPTHFSFTDGSVICKKCSVPADQPISPESLNILNTYISKDLSKCFFSQPTNKEVHKLVNDFLNYHLDRPLKSENFVK